MAETLQLNIVLMGENINGLMAGSMRLKNIFIPMCASYPVRILNILKNASTENPVIQKIDASDLITYRFRYSKKRPSLILDYVKRVRKILRSNFSPECNNILYIYGYPDIENVWMVSYAKKIGYKTVFDIVEDVRFSDSYSSFLNKLRNKSSEFVFNYLDRFSDGCVAISNKLVDLCKEKSRNRIPVLLSPVSVNPDKFNRTNSSIDVGPIRILYAGSFGEKDGVDIMIRALEQVNMRHKNFRFLMTGKGSNRHENNVKEIIANSEIKDKIEMLGLLSQDEYCRTVSSADILLMLRVNTPYANAGFPFKLGEYLASGKPTVATMVGEVQNYLTDRENAMLVKAGDIRGISEAILFLINNKEEAKKIGINGKKTAIHHFNSKKHSEVLFDFLSNL